MTDYELMVQSWVLRVGHYQLDGDRAAFRSVLNGVTDWTTVKCDGANLLHDGATTPLPAFVGAKDCVVLSDAFPPADPCASAGCSAIEAPGCCTSNSQSACCLANPCENLSCSSALWSTCCNQDCSSACCAGTPVWEEVC